MVIDADTPVRESRLADIKQLPTPACLEVDRATVRNRVWWQM